ncbi:siderophore-interacting protein [Pseudonocardia lacus]|uniref:siderophore-interacting protein n=1 Tax=Pseudonocardia lacus TaxID=2835865 RepID=UPI001BDD34A3|nr:siderophore-interacting protein [Pseudonocardia lacus]
MSSRPAAMAARVLRTAPVSPHMTRITLGGPELARFVGIGHDQVVRMFFPQPGQREPVIPDSGDWWETYQAIPEDRRPALRNYTVRRFDADALELDVDFVLHGDEGPASAWALRAAPGDVVGVCHDRTSAKWPEETDWLLLVADETGLPALSVILEELPPGLRTLAYVEVGGPEDRIDLATGPDVDVVWLHRDGVTAGRSDVVVRTLRDAALPEGEVFAWVAGESGMVKDVRRHLVRERGVHKRRVEFCGYWLHKVHDNERFIGEMQRLYAEVQEAAQAAG